MIDLRAIFQRALVETWDRPLNLSAVTAHRVCAGFAERSGDSDPLITRANDAFYGMYQFWVQG